MKITKEKDELVIRLPLTQKENNCYMDEKDLRDVHNLIGVCNKKKNEYTISQLCDLSYKGAQQEGMPYIFLEDEQELEEVCRKCGLSIWYK